MSDGTTQMVEETFNSEQMLDSGTMHKLRQFMNKVNVQASERQLL